MKVCSQESSYISPEASAILLSNLHGRDKEVQIAFEIRIGCIELHHGSVKVVHQDRTARPEEPELLNRGVDLGREREVCRQFATVGNDDPQFIDNVALAGAPQRGTRKSLSQDGQLGRIQEFGDLGDAMADDVLQKFAWQSTNPVIVVTQKSLDVARITEAIRENT